MAKESEKRFEAIMDKLFKTPQKSNPNTSSSVITGSPSGVQLSRSKKRPDMSPGLALIDAKSRSSAVGNWQASPTSSGSAQAPSCRPWDRDDLYRRLATFKSMTWFAKPQAVSAVNCARRGWINIDMDTIACESCGARLLFSTPSSWTQQQVEKAALVFSLKLDSGHKLLCPWVDNNCDESLAQFPSKPTAVLVEDYKNRFSTLLQLSALPVISYVSIHCLSNPQLEEFLKGSSDEENNGLADPGRSLISEQQSASPNSYYQAQKLISLCGWELRSLPYIVDRKVQQDYSTKNVHLANESSPASNRLELSVIYSPCPDGSKEADNESQVSALSDPNSAVLHCSLCSATVGLWTFSLVPRPVEFLRLVGYTEVNDKRGSGQPEDDENHDTEVGFAKTNFAAYTSAHENNMLNLTIAGGPPPEKQNYRAKISLPLIGRSLRARIFTDSSVDKDHNLSLSEVNIPRERTDQIGGQDSTIGNTMEDMQVVALESKKDDKLEADDLAKYRVQAGESMSSSREDNIMVAVNDKTGNTIETAHVKQGDKQHENVTKSTVQLVANNIDPGRLGKSSEQASLQKSMEFDPIRQHRVFCPWIASTAKSAPGWQQTLSALQRHKEISLPLPENTSLIEVDDPIASVKKLLGSPPRKRAKT